MYSEEAMRNCMRHTVAPGWFSLALPLQSGPRFWSHNSQWINPRTALQWVSPHRLQSHLLYWNLSSSAHYPLVASTRRMFLEGRCTWWSWRWSWLCVAGCPACVSQCPCIFVAPQNPPHASSIPCKNGSPLYTRILAVPFFEVVNTINIMVISIIDIVALIV